MGSLSFFKKDFRSELNTFRPTVLIFKVNDSLFQVGRNPFCSFQKQRYSRSDHQIVGWCHMELISLIFNPNEIYYHSIVILQSTQFQKIFKFKFAIYAGSEK